MRGRCRQPQHPGQRPPDDRLGPVVVTVDPPGERPQPARITPADDTLAIDHQRLSRGTRHPDRFGPTHADHMQADTRGRQPFTHRRFRRSLCIRPEITVADQKQMPTAGSIGPGQRFTRQAQRIAQIVAQRRQSDAVEFTHEMTDQFLVRGRRQQPMRMSGVHHHPNPQRCRQLRDPVIQHCLRVPPAIRPHIARRHRRGQIDNGDDRRVRLHGGRNQAWCARSGQRGA